MDFYSQRIALAYENNNPTSYKLIPRSLFRLYVRCKLLFFFSSSFDWLKSGVNEASRYMTYVMYIWICPYLYSEQTATLSMFFFNASVICNKCSSLEPSKLHANSSKDCLHKRVCVSIYIQGSQQTYVCSPLVRFRYNASSNVHSTLQMQGTCYCVTVIHVQ